MMVYTKVDNIEIFYSKKKNQDFVSRRMGGAKSKFVKLQSKLMDSTKSKIMINICYKSYIVLNNSV